MDLSDGNSESVAMILQLLLVTQVHYYSYCLFISTAAFLCITCGNVIC